MQDRVNAQQEWLSNGMSKREARRSMHARFLGPEGTATPDGSGTGHHHKEVNAAHPSPVSDLPHLDSRKLAGKANSDSDESTSYPSTSPMATKTTSATAVNKHAITNQQIAVPTQPPLATDNNGKIGDASSDTYHILIAATGSVASVKLPLIVQSLRSVPKVEVQVVITKTCKNFFDVDDLRKQGVKVWEDEDEWKVWHEVSDPVLHIELRRWAHLLLIAPLSANTMSALALGLCNNLLTNTIRAWDPSRPILVAPAMNTYMYNHPITKKQLKFIKAEMTWVEIIWPIEKVLACKEVGMGGMAEWGDIVGRVIKKLGLDPLREDDDEAAIDEEQEEENGGAENDEELVNTTSKLSL